MIKSSGRTLCPPGKRHFLEVMVSARRSPGLSQDNSDGTSLAAVSGQIILLGCHHEWLPRSPDLTHFDVFVWCYLKKLFLTPPANLADLHQRIIMKAAQIPENMIIRSMHEMRRAKLCIPNDGGHIEGRFGLRAD